MPDKGATRFAFSPRGLRTERTATEHLVAASDDVLVQDETSVSVEDAVSSSPGHNKTSFSNTTPTQTTFED